MSDLDVLTVEEAITVNSKLVDWFEARFAGPAQTGWITDDDGADVFVFVTGPDVAYRVEEDGPDIGPFDVEAVSEHCLRITRKEA